MSLDLFSSNIDDAVNHAARVSAPDLPSTFSDNFNDAFNKGYLTSQSISGEIRKTTARGQMIDDAIAKTGDQSFASFDGEGGGFDTAGFNAKIAKHKAARPDLELQPISDEVIQAKADEIGVRQLSDSSSFARRERTTGGTFGQFLGAAGAAFTDPVNLIAFPLAAPESLGILGTALAWGGIGAGSQTAIEALNATSMERIQPGYGASNQPVTNILETAVGGGVLGGGIKGLSLAWQRAKGGSWPRSVRDAGNVVDSEAQIAGTNPLPGVEGEAAHRTAISKAIDDLANGRPVDVDGIVPPEMVGHIDAYHGSPHDFDRFDISKINTGEGAQSYGHGLYFAEQSTVAEGYKSRVTNKEFVNKARELYDIGESPDEAARLMKEEADLSPAQLRLVDALEKDDWLGFDYPHEAISAALSKNAAKKWEMSPETIKAIADVGQIYKVRITANKDRMLDWDRAFDAQTPFVQDALRKLGIDDVNYAGMQGGRILETMGPRNSPETAKALADVGIPGIKYLDRGSRGSGEHTSNFVVFNDKHVEITHKNGQRVNAEIRQGVVDQSAGLPPKQPELSLAPPEPAKPPGPNAESVQALRDDLTPAKIEEARAHPDMEETVSRDLDKLMLEKPDLEVPTGVTVDADGRTVSTTRKVEDVVAEADSRLAAAKEIEGCVGPYPSEAAA